MPEARPKPIRKGLTPLGASLRASAEQTIMRQMEPGVLYCLDYGTGMVVFGLATIAFWGVGIGYTISRLFGRAP